jgi:hypothetical protein
VCMFRKSTVRPVFFVKSTVCPVFVRYVVSSVCVRKSTVRPVYFMKITGIRICWVYMWCEKYRTSGIFYESIPYVRYLLGMYVVCMFRKSTVRPVFFMKSPVFVVCSVYIQEKYRMYTCKLPVALYTYAYGYVQEKYRTSGIFF